MDFVAIDLETANEKRSSAAANILINIAKELNLEDRKNTRLNSSHSV